MVRGRKKVSVSKVLSFVTCGRKKLEKEYAQIGTPGFSRKVYINLADLHGGEGLNYTTNSISTTKYTFLNFIPKSLFEQFRRVANFYFLLTGLLAFTPLAPFAAVSAILPLCIVIAATMAKEGIEDVRRKQQDHEINNREVEVFKIDRFVKSQWKDLRVGDVVKVTKDQFFPADLLLLSSSNDDGVCFVETMNLDGETNLKLKQALEITQETKEQIKGTIKCEDPNAHLYSFVGTLELEDQPIPLSPQQLLLRDTKLRNTDYIVGAVVFTGHDTKAMQNATKPPSKRSRIEKKMDKIIYFLLTSLLLLALIGSIAFGVWTRADLKENGQLIRWYLRPDDAIFYFDPKRVALASFCHILTALMLYNYFIPISLYISVEIVKILQALFINQDVEMYHEESDKPTRARTSNLNEELGQVDTILSDKTGTLTANMMEFIKCSIAGVAYGEVVTEVEKAMARREGTLEHDDIEDNVEEETHHDEQTHVKGFNFRDSRIMDGQWYNRPDKDAIQNFFRLLSICHTCIAEEDDETGLISYEAESPDEAAFVIAARELGFEFYRRTQTEIIIREKDPATGTPKDITFKLMNILEFNSTRKRMSVIIRDVNNKIWLLSKGADSVMFKRLSKNGTGYEEDTKTHMNMYADAGLRTLVLAHRELSEKEYEEFNMKFNAAKTSVSADRDEKIEEAADSIERELVLLGATAVEDKLQKGVPECIDRLAQAGIKIWVLTGDRMETAINIGFACSLLRQGMTQIVITLESPEIIALERENDKDAITKASKDSVLQQIKEGKELVDSARSTEEVYALIIDGKSLTYALEDDVKENFWLLASKCVSVICCRSSPKQKALVTRLVKQGTKKVTLGIGDGANDVGMLQEADIGIGISGAEGMQAVMASDVAIAQFRFLERLLLVHGHWCYRRISLMICYFFYKNVTFGITLFLFEAYTSFSGQPAYNDWFLALYNVVFTSLPVIALGVFDQDVSAKLCLKFPRLYQEGVRNELFSWRKIFGWMFAGVINAFLIFFLSTRAAEYQAFRQNGQVATFDVLGPIMYSSVVWVVNIQMALSLNYFTVIQHVVIWGSIAIWYVFLLAYGNIDIRFSTTAYKVFEEKLAPAPFYWITILLVVLTTLIPYTCYAALQTQFFPMFHNIIQLNKRRQDDPEFKEFVRQWTRTPGRVGISRLVSDSKRIQEKYPHI